MSLLLLALWAARDPVTFHDSGHVWNREVARLGLVLQTLPSGFEKTVYLREYVGRLVDIGRLDATTERRFRSLNFESFSAAEFYPLFRTDLLPGDCGITSYFYIKLLHAFGFKAYQYSFGFTTKPYDRYIHSVALVEVDVRGEPRLIVQDAYLNLTYRNLNGEPIDFFDFLSALKEKDDGRIVMDQGSVTTLLLVPDTSLYFPYLSEPCRASMTRALTRRDGSLMTQLPIARDYPTLMQTPCGGFERGFVDALQQNGVPGPFIYAYTLRASEMIGSPDHGEVQRRIDQTLR